jgi:hypothetical protein
MMALLDLTIHHPLILTFLPLPLSFSFFSSNLLPSTSSSSPRPPPLRRVLSSTSPEFEGDLAVKAGSFDSSFEVLHCSALRYSALFAVLPPQYTVSRIRASAQCVSPLLTCRLHAPTLLYSTWTLSSPSSSPSYDMT